MKCLKCNVFGLNLSGILFLLIHGDDAQVTLPATSRTDVVTTEIDVTTWTQSNRSVLSTFGKTATYRERTGGWPDFASKSTRSSSQDTTMPSITAATATEAILLAIPQLKRNTVMKKSSSSTEPSQPEAVRGAASMRNVAADVATTTEAVTTRAHLSQGHAAITEMEAPNSRQPKFTLDSLRVSIKQFIPNSGSEFMRKLLQADISSDCSIGLHKFARAIQDLEPWALRLIDATAKYPTGLFQSTLVDLGAYDECIETVVRDEQGVEKVRGQYCDVHVLPTVEEDILAKLLPAFKFSFNRAASFQDHTKTSALPGIRLGVCTIDACDERDLASIARSLVGTVFKITVKDCVTSVQKGINSTQTGIIAFLAVLATLILAATAFEVFTKSWDKRRKTAAFYQRIVAFSALANTRLLLTTKRDKKSETSCYQFIHGLRFLSIFWIALGHCYILLSENYSRSYNAFIYMEQWHGVIISAGYMSVDIFFFISGYLLYDVLNKQNKNRAVVVAVALFRRFYRITVPVFFMIMCMYLLPLIASGPNSKEFYDRFYAEVHKHWWHLLVQFRNWDMEDSQTVTMLHLWYLSADFQLFLVSVVVIQVFRGKKWCIPSIFSALSLVCCGASAWQIYGTNMMPFVVSSHPQLKAVFDTVMYLYVRPYYHAVCFFFGCNTCVLVETYRKAHISKTGQALLWGVALFCGLYCIFMKAEWHQTDDIPPVAKRMFFTFIDRILWTVMLVWLTFTCITGRGGFLNKFLSWSAFAPLARLSFGVYLIHLPLHILSLRLAREPIFYSHYTLLSQCFALLLWSYILSYFLFIACEAPLGRLDKLLFMRGPQNGLPQHSSTQNGVRCNNANNDGTGSWAARTTQGQPIKDYHKEDCSALEKGAYFSEGCDSVRCRL